MKDKDIEQLIEMLPYNEALREKIEEELYWLKEKWTQEAFEQPRKPLNY